MAAPNEVKAVLGEIDIRFEKRQLLIVVPDDQKLAFEKVVVRPSDPGSDLDAPISKARRASSWEDAPYTYSNPAFTERLKGEDNRHIVLAILRLPNNPAAAEINREARPESGPTSSLSRDAGRHGESGDRFVRRSPAHAAIITSEK